MGILLGFWDNTPNAQLSDGFKQGGNPGFTRNEFGLTGNFCDATTAVGTQRDGDWALAITGRQRPSRAPGSSRPGNGGNLQLQFQPPPQYAIQAKDNVTRDISRWER